jgi:shikimate kinase
MDTDSVICQKERKTLQKIIDENGLDFFLKLECEIGRTVVCDRVVIATGGSMVLSEEAMLHLKQLGTVVFIDVPLSVLRNRLGNYKDRGIAMKDGVGLEELFLERKPLYERFSDLTVSYIENDSLEETVDEIVNSLNDM